MIGQAPADALVWLLTVEADTTRRWVSRDCELVIDGAAVPVATGLRSDDRTMRLDAEDVTSTIALALDPAEVIGFVRGMRLGVAELALVPVAAGVGSHAERVVVASGRIGDVEVDPEAGRVSFAVRPLEQADPSDLAPPSTAISDRTWPTAPEQGRGARAPRVYGAPGAYQYPTVTDITFIPTWDFSDPTWWASADWKPFAYSRTVGATPGLAVDVEELTVQYYDDSHDISLTFSTYPRYVIVAQHAVDATQVTAWMTSDLIGLYSATLDLVRTTDGLGRVVTLADIGSHDYIVRRAQEWWIGWDLGRATSPLLSDVLADVLRDAAVRVDWPSIQAASRYLAAFAIGGYVDDSVSAVAWAQARLPLYGARLRWTGRGLGVVITAPPHDARPVARLTVGEGCVRDAPWSLTGGELDVVVVRWAPARTVGRTMETVVRRRGVRAPIRDTVDAPEVWDDVTAARVGAVALWEHGPAETMGVAVPAGRWWWLGVGDVVDVEDTALGFTAGPNSRWVVVAAQLTDRPYRSLRLRRLAREPVEVLAPSELTSG